MKVGDTVKIEKEWSAKLGHKPGWAHFAWDRLGLVLGFEYGMVQVFWGEDFPCEDEYLDQLLVV